MSQLIENFSSQIERMHQHLKDQRHEIEELKKQLQEYREDMIVIQNLYEKEVEGNNVLTDQWNMRFSSQQKRIDSIIEIAKAELVVKFVETLVQNNFGTDILSTKKLFKAAVAVDSIYRARHGKYVSEIYLATLAIKYTVERSKLVINIDNHITSCRSYNRFLKWQDELSKQEKPLPDGLLFVAFDNEQKGQKNYLDRGFNMVTYHIVTSFVAFNMSSENKTQHTNLPWAYDSLNRSQFDELFNISTQMQEVIDEELHSYLAEVLKLLSEEKLSTTNTIDSLVASTSTNTIKMKTCPSCNLKNIENRKKNAQIAKCNYPRWLKSKKSK
ncbi:hypothetical protein F8M41_023091 [Gigaspora margarita]|uniref:Uncharacterized protein n=1 Tax=Gigaspora margarita TaxID=4874 RepID=A0A8H4AE13_GIGMA|nr:hypothetical protein F8M41_023091 [Gigaspora margarita]